MTDLQKISKEIRELTAASCGAALRVAELLLQAKEEFFANASDAWVDWCRVETGYRRRSAFSLKKIAECVRACKTAGIDLSAICCTYYAKIEEIARFEDVSEIKKFLKNHDVAALDREELRAAVKAFIDPDAAKKKPRQLDFFKTWNLPEPEDMRTSIKAAEDFDVNRALDYGFVLFDSAFNRSSQISPENIGHLEKALIIYQVKLEGFRHAK